MIEELKHFPIPKIEGSTETYDYRFEDMRLTAVDLLPESLHIKSESDVIVNMEQLHTDKAKTNVTIIASKLKTRLENVKFWFRRKGTLIDLEDDGYAGVALKGDGTTITIQLKLDDVKLFRVKKVQIDMDKIDIHIFESKHDWLLNFITGIFSNTIKELLERRFEEKIWEILEVMEDRINSLLISLPSTKLKEAIKSKISSY